MCMPSFRTEHYLHYREKKESILSVPSTSECVSVAYFKPNWPPWQRRISLGPLWWFLISKGYYQKVQTKMPLDLQPIWAPKRQTAAISQQPSWLFMKMPNLHSLKVRLCELRVPAAICWKSVWMGVGPDAYAWANQKLADTFAWFPGYNKAAFWILTTMTGLEAVCSCDKLTVLINVG